MGVRRHQHLLLFDDDQQIEVRYVIPLAHHDVTIYAGGEAIPEGELFIKRNAICLTRRLDAGEVTADGQPSKPFFLFADNLSDKEDFYFALLKNMERRTDDPQSAPTPLQFDVKHIIELVQRLHSSEEHMQIRWFNAMLGRIFLGIYKTPDVENFIRAKITKKISRVKKPAFLSKIVIRKVELGEGAPYITNPRLKDLTVDGDCTIEADMSYTGNARLEIAATARIELGTRFKAREVDLVLAVTCKRIEGHMLFRIKPPPSNRVWMTFEHPPRIDLSIEPIVSSRQITYNVILRQIENRIKEVIAESLVMPFWDDLSFFNTAGKTWRGGVFVDRKHTHQPPSAEDLAAADGDVEAMEHLEESSSGSSMSPPIEKSISTPNLMDGPTIPSHTLARKAASSVFGHGKSKLNASSPNVDTKPSHVSEPGTPPSMRRSSNATPVGGVDNTTASAMKDVLPSNDRSPAVDRLAALNSRSPPVSALDPAGSPSKIPNLSPSVISSSSSGFSTEDTTTNSYAESELKRDDLSNITSETNLADSPLAFGNSAENLKFPNKGTSTTTSSLRTVDTDSSATSSQKASSAKKTAMNAVASAAENARKWGLSAIARTREAKAASEAETERDRTLPMGRGQPLPPPGTPLPMPEKGKGKTAPMPVPKRKPVQPPPDLAKDLGRTAQTASKHGKTASASSFSGASFGGASVQGQAHLAPAAAPPPPLPRRRQHAHVDEPAGGEGMFVVPAPESEPTSPMEGQREYLSPSIEEEVDQDLPELKKKPTPPALPRRRPSVNGDEEIPVVRA